MTRYSGFIVGELICEFSTSRKSSLSPSCLALIRSSSGSSEPFGASISTRPSSGTAATSIGSWIDSPPITTSGVSTPDWVDGRPSSDAARLCANRRIYMTSPGNPTVPVSSTRQLLRDQQFAIVRIRTYGRFRWLEENVYGVWSTRVATKSGARSPTPKPESYRRNVPTHSGRPQTRRRTDDGTTPTSLRIIVAMCCWLEKPQATATSAIGIGLL